MALHRWEPFLGAFPHIDAAIEAADADGLLSRDEIRNARERIVELLCDAADDDDGGERAEGLCALLDEAMAGSLATLQAVPVEKIELASGDLVGAVGALMRGHASERVRGLASDVALGWRAGAMAELAGLEATMNMLDGLPSTPPPPPQDDTAPAADSDTKAKKIPEQQPRPRKIAVVSSCRVSTAESYGPLPKKRAPTVSTSNAKPWSENIGAPTVVLAPPKKKRRPSSSAGEKMEATKRKLHERYQEAEDAKRWRTIQVIKPPRPAPGTTGQRQHNAHPAVRVRGQASCAAERCFMKSCTLRRRV